MCSVCSLQEEVQEFCHDLMKHAALVAVVVAAGHQRLNLMSSGEEAEAEAEMKVRSHQTVEEAVVVVKGVPLNSYVEELGELAGVAGADHVYFWQVRLVEVAVAEAVAMAHPIRRVMVEEAEAVVEVAARLLSYRYLDCKAEIMLP